MPCCSFCVKGENKNIRKNNMNKKNTGERCEALLFTTSGRSLSLPEMAGRHCGQYRDAVSTYLPPTSDRADHWWAGKERRLETQSKLGYRSRASFGHLIVTTIETPPCDRCVIQFKSMPPEKLVLRHNPPVFLRDAHAQEKNRGVRLHLG